MQLLAKFKKKLCMGFIATHVFFILFTHVNRLLKSWRESNCFNRANGHFALIRGRSCVKKVIFSKKSQFATAFFKVNFAFLDFQLISNLLFLVCFDTAFIYSTKIQECCQEGVQGTN